MSFRIDRGQIIPVSGENKITSVNSSSQEFQRILYETIEKDREVKISAHAKLRMDERNIVLEKEDMDIITGAINKLEQKGAKESLMLYKDYAFIASIKNRTIITSMDTNEMEIVTNIDSIIIVK